MIKDKNPYERILFFQQWAQALGVVFGLIVLCSLAVFLPTTLSRTLIFSAFLAYAVVQFFFYALEERYLNLLSSLNKATEEHKDRLLKREKISPEDFLKYWKAIKNKFYISVPILLGMLIVCSFVFDLTSEQRNLPSLIDSSVFFGTLTYLISRIVLGFVYRDIPYPFSEIPSFERIINPLNDFSNPYQPETAAWYFSSVSPLNRRH